MQSKCCKTVALSETDETSNRYEQLVCVAIKNLLLRKCKDFRYIELHPLRKFGSSINRTKPTYLIQFLSMCLWTCECKHEIINMVVRYNVSHCPNVDPY